MTTLFNNFEEGTSGTTVTTGNSSGADGSNAFNNTFIGTGCTLTYDNTHAAHGSLALLPSVGSTATSAVVIWSTSMGTQTTVYFRAYLYFPANPPVYVRPVNTKSGSSVAGAIAINTAGELILVVQASGALTFTDAIPLNQWFRIEGYVTGDPSVGAVSCSLYNSMDSTTATETHTVTSQNTVGQLTSYTFGNDSGVANAGSCYWLDDIGVSTAGYLGPAGYAGTGDAALTLTATSTGAPAFAKPRGGAHLAAVLAAAGLTD